MKLVILGATGGTGLEIVGRSIERGHCVTTFVRSPERLKRFQDRITIQQGDVLNADVLGRVIQDHDAVVSGFGPRVPISKQDANLLQRFGGTLRKPIWCEREAPGGNHTMSRAQLTRGFLWFSVLGWGIGLGAIIRPYRRGGSVGRCAANLAWADALWPTLSDKPRGFLPAVERADGGRDTRSAHQWMEDAT